MDFDEICIKAYDGKEDIGKLNDVWDEVVKQRFEFSNYQLQYLNLMFNIYATDLINRELKRVNNLEKKISMQYNNSEYKQDLHERKKALTVKNPYAEWIAQGKKSIEVRSRNTKYRGELVICSSKSPEIDGMQSGCTLAIVNLYQTKPVRDFTDDEWKKTCIPEKEQTLLIVNNYYGWFLKDVVRLVEYPVNGQLGIWNLVFDKLEFVPYSGSVLKHIPVVKKREFDRGAVIKGCFILIGIFALMAGLITWIVIALFG